MSNFLQSLSRFRKSNKPRRQRRRAPRRRCLAMEALERREMLSLTTLQSFSVSENTGEKPQSKVFEYAGQWWNVMPTSDGTWVHRLDGTGWTPTQQITSEDSFHADVKLVNDLAHVLLFDDKDSQLATLQYDPVDNRFEPWALRPQLIDVPIASSAETATIEVDSTGRMWVVYDVSSGVEVRYSDGLYTSWSSAITVGSGIKSDDLASIVALPNNSIGVMWSNQNDDIFEFRVHRDGDAPGTWSSTEVAAPQWVNSVGGNMSDDHVNLAVTSDGTMYAAVKTSYTKSSQPLIALLVRRPDGSWDNLYHVDSSGTRPIVVVNEAAGKLIVAYTEDDNGGDIVYRESPLDVISFGSRQTLISGSNNNVTSTKHTSTNEIVFLAGSSSTVRGVRYTFDVPLPTNLAPVVDAGAEQSIALGIDALLDGTVTDDGLPGSGTLTATWSLVTGPGSVVFGDASQIDTTATFSDAGVYVLRLTASDGDLSTSDEVTIEVTSPIPAIENEPPVVVAGNEKSVYVGDSVTLNGSAVDDGEIAPLAVQWSVLFGPGTVTFGNASSPETTATFSAPGTYKLQLTADDGEHTIADEVLVRVFSAEPVVVKTIVHEGAVYSLDSDGWLRYNGLPVWANTYDFAFSPVDGTMYWQSTYGLFQHRLANGQWQNLDYDVVKFAISDAGDAYSLGADTWLNLNGVPVWHQTKDFQFSADQSLYWLSTWGLLQRQLAVGVWENLGQNVGRFALPSSGAVYTLGDDHFMDVNGANVWATTQDFIYTANHSFYWLSTYGLLQLQNNDGTWQDLGVDVNAFAVDQDGTVCILHNDGRFSFGGVDQHTDIVGIETDEFGALVLEDVSGQFHRVLGRFELRHAT